MSERLNAWLCTLVAVVYGWLAARAWWRLRYSPTIVLDGVSLNGDGPAANVAGDDELDEVARQEEGLER